jgi:Ca-activated chloride channel homolog
LKKLNQHGLTPFACALRCGCVTHNGATIMLLKTSNTHNPLALALSLALLTGLSGCEQMNRAEQEAGRAEPTRAQSASGPVIDQTTAQTDDKAKLESLPSPPPEVDFQAAEKKTDADTALEEIEVTGSRIRRADNEAAQPVMPAIAQAPASPPAAPVVLARNAPAVDAAAPLALGTMAPPEPAPELVADSENYAHTAANPVKQTAAEPVSTFSIDVDTGSYTNARRMLTQENRLPPKDAVRAEEFINYFDYGYPQPANRAQPFSVTTELGAAPWNAKHELLLIGLKGFEIQKNEIPPANLVFLLDVSGSMDEPNKLPLLKASITQMVERMSARDFVSIVVYAGAAGVVLEPTPGNNHEKILAALTQLSAGGSTNGGEGIELAYKLANANKIPGGVNRIILATDGDFNVGQFNQDKLKEFVAAKRDTGITLSTLGFGAGNYNDAMAEQLADVGNGKYAYIDSIDEATRTLGREVAGSLYTIAGDVKIQIEFNPSLVSEYRLIGYANRMLAKEDFNNDKVDAGDIGVGHTVTALYEITRVGSGGESIDPLRYTNKPAGTGGKELGFLKLRYKLPNQSESILISQAIAPAAHSSYRLQYAAMVAAFAEHLGGGKYLNNFGLSQIEQALKPVKQSEKAELLSLIAIAKQIEGPTVSDPIARVEISTPDE